jgi:CheY-like chemotaxis protein
VEICVSDTGHGMSKEVRAKAFEPFFTTKDVGKGSGLGLSQVLGFAKQSGGGVCVMTEEGRGTAICVYLPPADGAATALHSETTSAVTAPHSGAVILLVDDDNAVRDVTATYLRELGYQVLEAGSGGAALEVLGSSAAVDLLLLDYAMPGMNGAELSRRARGRRPRLPILFVTGFAEQDAFKDISERDIVRKPINVQELSTKLRASLSARLPVEGGMPA